MIRNRATRLWMFCLLVSIAGCSVAKSPISRNFTIKPLGETAGESLVELRNVMELTLETEISSRIIIPRGASHSNIDYFKTTLNILPFTDKRQTILNLETIPAGKISGRSIEFRLDAPRPGRHAFQIKAEAKLRHEFIKVTDKISFPLKEIPKEVISYTKPSSMIDSDDAEIRALASSIAQGEDDLYRVVFKASKWVRKHVQPYFDITTLSVSRKASWVLENRKGVCDEQTNLFLGILRSLEIPAKFITGIVSMNYNGKTKYKLHAWAEVYFPSAGWIPFDIAYNQPGFIDATHFKLTESVDIPDSFASHEWASYAEILIQDLDIRAKIVEKTGIISPLLEIKPKVWHTEVDSGSYNVVEASLINPHKFYVAADISLQIPEGLKVMGEHTQMVLMEPDTIKTVYWIVKPTIEIPTVERVGIPMNIVSSRNAIASTKYYAKNGAWKYGFEVLQKAVEKKIKGALR